MTWKAKSTSAVYSWHAVELCSLAVPVFHHTGEILAPDLIPLGHLNELKDHKGGFSITAI